jgi:preprotein translocase subunit SecB
MSTTKDLPLSGYALTGVFTKMQELREKELAADKERHGAINVGWDWAFVGEEAFDVEVSVSVEPTHERPEFFSTAVVGRFRQVGKGQSVELERFAHLQAVAILLPYVRQVLSNLTSMSPYGGAFYLPSLNVVNLMKDFDPKNATGSNEIREREAKRLPGKRADGAKASSRSRASVKHK